MMKATPKGLRLCLRAARGRALSALCVFLLMQAAGLAAQAAPLAKYRERVHTAMLIIDTLSALDEEDAEAEAEESLADVRVLLPQTEEVEWGGTRMVVNNAWLHQSLDEYERGAAAGGAEAAARAESLRNIAERLHALEARLVESEKGGGGARDKDAEKGRLTNILSHPAYNRKASEGGALQRIIEQIFQWIRDLIPSFGPIAPGASPRVSRAAQIFVLALCLGVIAFVVWKYWWQRREHGIRLISLREPRVVLGERLAADQTAADLLADAERLARAGDLRGAIRKAYVALLCDLGDRRVIRLAQHKTNRDYLQAIRASAPPRLYTEMLPLTFNFELHWYGLQAAEEGDWKDFHQRCRQLLKGLRAEP
ncbi:MAG: DUF4129 domain-containing protein [Acidobacteria bacterium]|nr:DUF4129 domain-containing protein [Acidobacteriota bacterium]